MQTIGERLEEARKRKGISIREAAEATKIRGDYLHKMESNSFDLNLPEIYIRGFLRNYAVYLKINADKLLADYKSLAPNEGRLPRRDNREIYGRMDLAPTDRQTTADTAPAGGTAEGGPPPPAHAIPSQLSRCDQHRNLPHRSGAACQGRHRCPARVGAPGRDHCRRPGSFQDLTQADGA
jgi:transcriptional regulator with XRE-family HTH domain